MASSPSHPRRFRRLVDGLPCRGPYRQVEVLHVEWYDENHPHALPEGLELATVFRDLYAFTYNRITLYSAHEEDEWEPFWLLERALRSFVYSHNEEGNLKIFYYFGGSYVLPSGDMMLQSPQSLRDGTGGGDVLHWSPLQAWYLEVEALTDVFLIMDCPAYDTPAVFPPTRPKWGITEIFTPSASQEPSGIEPGWLTALLVSRLRSFAEIGFSGIINAASLAWDLKVQSARVLRARSHSSDMRAGWKAESVRFSEKTASMKILGSEASDQECWRETGLYPSPFYAKLFEDATETFARVESLDSIPLERPLRCPYLSAAKLERVQWWCDCALPWYT